MARRLSASRALRHVALAAGFLALVVTVGVLVTVGWLGLMLATGYCDDGECGGVYTLTVSTFPLIPSILSAWAVIVATLLLRRWTVGRRRKQRRRDRRHLRRSRLGTRESLALAPEPPCERSGRGPR
jgi:uncharacterized membrane protein